MRDFVSAIGLLRAPILVALTAVAVLLLPSQSREVFRAITEMTGTAFAMSIARLTLGALLLGVAILMSGTALLATPPSSRFDALRHYGPVIEATALSLPLFPLTAIVLAALDQAWLDSHLRPVAQHRGLVIAGIGLAVMLLLVGILLVLPDLRTAILAGCRRLLAPVQRLGSVIGLAILVSVFAALCLAAGFLPVHLGRALGPLLLILLFFALICIAVSLLTHVYDKHQIPALAIAVAGSFVWAAIPSNNNHYVRTLTEPLPEAVNMTDAFRAWMAARPDLADYKDRPYPVYIVSAEGGGIYAAAHAASVLTRLQDGCPRFADHVFAMSGVSGGSLGVALFAGLVDGSPSLQRSSRDCEAGNGQPGPLQETAHRFFEEDFLTPLLAASLFPDGFQRFFPVAIPAFDRARALEASIDKSWKISMREKGITGHDDFFGRPVRAAWSPAGRAPALLLSGTVVSSGERVVIAPFQLKVIVPIQSDQPGGTFRDRYADILNGTTGVSTSTAVGISARFPLVTPPASFSLGQTSIQIVDGGYYDNSGLRTAVDLIENIRRQALGNKAALETLHPIVNSGCAPNNSTTLKLPSGDDKSVCFKLIVIGGFGFPPRQIIYGELLTPMMALYEARYGLGLANSQSVHRVYCGGEYCGYGALARNPHIYSAYYLRSESDPLGWYLSAQSLESIEKPYISAVPCMQIVQASLHAGGAAAVSTSPSLVQTLNIENGCISARVSWDLFER